MDKRSPKRTGTQQQDTSFNDATVDPAVAAALATQQQTFQTILDSQLKTFQACLQACMDATNKRIDTFVRETITAIAELKASLQYTQKEVDQMKEDINNNSDQRVVTDRLLQRLDADVRRLDDNDRLPGELVASQQPTGGRRQGEARRDVGGDRGGASTSRQARTEAASWAGRQPTNRVSAPPRGSDGPARQNDCCEIHLV